MKHTRRKSVKRTISLLSIILISLVLVSCGKTNLVISDPDSLFNSDFVSTINYEDQYFNVSASDSGIYKLQDGVISYYEIESNQSVELQTVNVVDDERFNGRECPAYNNYCEISQQEFFQYYDNKLFYISLYASTEGETIYKLNYLDVISQDQKSVLSFESYPDMYNMVVFNEYLLYIEVYDNSYELIAINLNTLEKNVIDYSNSEDNSFISFQHSDQILYVHTYNKETSLQVFSRLNFDELKLEEMFRMNGGIFDGYDGNLLTFEIDETAIPNHRFELVNMENETITEFDSNLLVRYVNKNYVFASSMEMEQRYYVLDHQGNIVYEIPIPDEISLTKYVSNESGVEGFLQLQGVIGDYLYIIEQRGGELFEYLVNYKTQQWSSLYH